MEVSYRFAFDAAHRFENFPDGHPYRGVHGHSFQVEIAIEGKPDAATGFVADLGEVQRECDRVRGRLDHRMLNEIEELAQPSLENLCIFVWRELAPRFPGLARVTVGRDSQGQACTYEGK